MFSVYKAWVEAANTKKCDDAVPVVTAYEEIIKIRKMNIMQNCFTYRQGHIFKKFNKKKTSLEWETNHDFEDEYREVNW